MVMCYQVTNFYISVSCSCVLHIWLKLSASDWLFLPSILLQHGGPAFFSLAYILLITSRECRPNSGCREDHIICSHLSQSVSSHLGLLRPPTRPSTSSTQASCILPIVLPLGRSSQSEGPHQCPPVIYILWSFLFFI